MKRTLLLSGLLLSLHADMDNYVLQKEASTQEKYFIKFAATSNIENARKIQLIIDFPTKIIYMKEYYSLVSDEFQSRHEAKAVWKKVRKAYKDAYIFKLYKKQIIAKPIPKRIKLVKKPNKHQKAITLYNAKRYEEALMAFDMILIDTPNDINAKIYYAKTLYKLSLFKESKKEFELLLLTPLDNQTKKEIQDYLTSIERKQKKHFFNAVIGVGAGHDDNINLATDDKTTQYGPYTLINDTNKTDSTYGLASLSLTHRYMGKFFDLYSSLYSYNEFAHVAEGNDLNFIDISSRVVKSYKNFSVSLPFGLNTSYLDGDDIGYNLYTNPTVTYAINQKLKTFMQASFIDNTTKFAENRDYHAVGGGLGIRYIKDRFQGALGVNIQKFTAKKDLRFDISKDAVSYLAYGKYYLLKGFYVGTDLFFKNDNYSDLDEIMGYKREDEIFRYGLSMGKNITKNTLVNLKYQHTKNSSNINAYSYEKNNYAVEGKYKF